MSKYKIIPIQHLLKNNQIAKAGEVVDGKAFINLQDSLDRGFCKLDEEEVEQTKKEKTIQHLKTLNKEPLIEWALENEYDVDEDLKKKELLASLIEQVEADEE